MKLDRILPALHNIVTRLKLNHELFYDMTPSIKLQTFCSWSIIECYAINTKVKELYWWRRRVRQEYGPVTVEFSDHTVNEIYVSASPIKVLTLLLNRHNPIYISLGTI